MMIFGLVAERRRTVHQTAFCVAVHAALDIFRHILYVELIHVHHLTFREASGGGIVEIFLDIKNADTVIGKATLVHHSFKHISADKF